MRARDPKMMISALVNRAKQGDARAIAELQKLQQILTVAQHDALAVDGPATDDEAVFGADDLDIADAYAGQYSDELARKVALRGHKWNDLNQVANFARMNPPSVLQGITGNQAIVRSGDPAIEVANWGGHDAETLPVTVTVYPVQQLSAAPPEGTIGIISARPFAIVQYGTKGFLVRAEVDIGLGCQFTLSASSVVLQVAMDPPNPPAVFFATEPGTMKLSGMLSFWPIVRTKPITRTLYVDSISGGAAVILPIPAAAKDVIVLAQGVLVAIQLDVLDVNGIVIYTFFTPVAPAPSPGIMFDPVILSGDAVSIQVTNNAVGGAQVRLVFGLEF